MSFWPKLISNSIEKMTVFIGPGRPAFRRLINSWLVYREHEFRSPDSWLVRKSDEIWLSALFSQGLSFDILLFRNCQRLSARPVPIVQDNKIQTNLITAPCKPIAHLFWSLTGNPQHKISMKCNSAFARSQLWLFTMVQRQLNSDATTDCFADLLRCLEKKQINQWTKDTNRQISLKPELLLEYPEII